MTAPASIWDNADIAPDTGEYIKFENVGDKVSGIVQKIGIHRWDDGSASPQLSLVTDDGEPKTFTAGTIRLKMALAEQRPEQGDHLYVELTNIEKRAAGKTLKHYNVVTTRGGKPATQAPAPAATIAPAPAAPMTPAYNPPVPPAAPANVNPDAVAAALAALTPEMRQAMGMPA